MKSESRTSAHSKSASGTADAIGTSAASKADGKKTKKEKKKKEKKTKEKKVKKEKAHAKKEKTAAAGTFVQRPAETEAEAATEPASTHLWFAEAEAHADLVAFFAEISAQGDI